MGLVTVVGIAARNGIMLVSHYSHLETQEGMEFGRDLVGGLFTSTLLNLFVVPSLHLRWARPAAVGPSEADLVEWTFEM